MKIFMLGSDYVACNVKKNKIHILLHCSTFWQRTPFRCLQDDTKSH